MARRGELTSPETEPVVWISTFSRAVTLPVTVKGENFVVASDVKQAFTKRFGEIQVRFVSLTGLVEHLRAKTAGSEP